MQTVEHATQAAYLAVQIAVENAARRHSVAMVRHSHDYDTCMRFSKTPGYRDRIAALKPDAVAAVAKCIRTGASK